MARIKKATAKKAAPKKVGKRPAPKRQAPQEELAPVPTQQNPQPPMGTPPMGANGPMMRKGGKIKKAQTGTVQSANQQTQSNVNKIAMKNAGDSIKKSMAGNAKNGKSMKKCRYGCK